MDKWVLVNVMVVVVLAILLGDTLGKSLNAASTIPDLMNMKEHRCGCEISVDNSTRGHYDLGNIKIIKLRHTYPSVASTCHAVRHRCHKACAQAADLSTKIDGKETLGYKLCMRHEQMTQGSGAKVLSRGRIDTPECQRHHHMKASPAKQKLCCGHSLISVKDKFVQAFGWNPDCKHVTYILGY